MEHEGTESCTVIKSSSRLQQESNERKNIFLNDSYEKIYHFYWMWDAETCSFWLNSQCKHNLTTYRAPCRWFIKAKTVPAVLQAKWEVVPQPRNQRDNSFNLLPALRPHHSQPQLARQTNLQHLKGQYVIRISTIGCCTRTDPNPGCDYRRSKISYRRDWQQGQCGHDWGDEWGKRLVMSQTQSGCHRQPPKGHSAFSGHKDHVTSERLFTNPLFRWLLWWVCPAPALRQLG